MIRVATRGSALARWQAERVGALLAQPVEYVLISTTGDRDQRADLHAIGGTGVFTKEVQQAVLEGRADIAVHSAKDLPSETRRVWCSPRCPNAATRATRSWARRSTRCRRVARVGTGSVRRRAQLAAARPDLVFAPLRGNIETRLRKRADEGHHAVVVAVAALERLGLMDQVSEVLAPAVLLPQAAQGALGVECRADDAATLDRLAEIDDPVAHRAVRAERAFLAELGGGCSLPCGALARRPGDRRARARRAARVARREHRVADARDGLRRGRGRPGSGARSARRQGRPRPARDRIRSMTVYLVGAGPGDPGLLTVRGAELLRRADVVVYDRLASPALLELAPGAELVDVGKAPGRVAMTQEQINELLVERGRAGLEVVRLKGGDPFVFGRGGEEAESCRDAGVAFEVVPGITSAIAAPAYAGHPGDAPRALHQRDDRDRPRRPDQGNHRHRLGRAGARAARSSCSWARAASVRSPRR